MKDRELQVERDNWARLKVMLGRFYTIRGRRKQEHSHDGAMIMALDTELAFQQSTVDEGMQQDCALAFAKCTMVEMSTDLL